MAGAFVWYELSTPDLPAATAFYTHVFGWSAAEGGTSGAHPYTLFSAMGVGVAGAMPILDPPCDGNRQAHWVGYLGVEDVDRAAEQVDQLGGRVLNPPTEIPGVGRFAVVADIHGAVFNLFKGEPRDTSPSPPPHTAGAVGWHELHAGDGRSAFAFYEAIAGWTRGDALAVGAMGVYQPFFAGEVILGGIRTKAPDEPGPQWLFYFNVEGLGRAMERVRAAHGALLSGPHQIPGGPWIAICADPQGAMFALLANTP